MEKSPGNTRQPGGTSNKAGKSKGNGNTHRNYPSTTETETEGRGTTTSRDTTDNPTSESQGTPRLVVVDPPPGTEPTQKPRKQRPTGLTYNKGDKTKAAAKGSQPAATTVILVQSVIQTLFMVGSTRAGEHWVITDEEAEAIATPAANIIAKYADTDAIAKYSDPAALVIALGTVVMPRVMIQMSKKEVKPNVGLAKQPSQPNRGSSGNDSQRDNPKPVRDAGDPAKANVEQLLQLAVNSPY